MQNDQKQTPRRGVMLILSSPSGAGKTTLSRRLLDEVEDISLSVSATTRQPRKGEIEGIDYFFVDDDRFHQMVTSGAFLEHAKVFGNSYGTPAGPVHQELEEGRDVLFDIDWQGAQQMQKVAAADIVRVFILPPSLEELHSRLKGRGQDSDEVVEARMQKASSEISHWDAYDYVLVNDDVETCLAQLKHVLEAERMRLPRRIKSVGELAKSMMGDE
ncbi:MAG: guanylate kinase [Sphingomonadales bacterium]|nr:guanylate kinase [Sphingomonadales bacterium]